MSKGYFVISDITGYTGFLTQSELDHAQDILKTLFDTLLDEMKAPLIISNFQGDAILTYAPLESVPRGESLLQQVESTYLAYTHKLDLMKNNTTCLCKACANMKSLDLKFFVHFGEYLLQDMRGKAELSGSDVIIAHRMMKNNVKEQVGLKAYALFSKAAVDQLGLQDFTCEMHSHNEDYEHIGAVPMYAYCLKTMWEKRRDERRVKVSDEELWFQEELTVAAPPSFVWDCYMIPELRQQAVGANKVHISDIQNGRAKIGTNYHCAHGNTISHHQIIDLQPLKYLTEHLSGFPMGLAGLMYSEFEKKGEETHITIRIAKLKTNHPIFRFIAPAMMPTIRKQFQDDIHKMLQTINRLVAERSQSPVVAS